MEITLDQMCMHNEFVLLDTSVSHNSNDIGLTLEDKAILRNVFGTKCTGTSKEDQLRYKKMITRKLEQLPKTYVTWQVLGEIKNGYTKSWKGPKLACLRYAHDALVAVVEKKVLEDKLKALPEAQDMKMHYEKLRLLLAHHEHSYGLSSTDYGLLLHSFNLATFKGSIGLATNDHDLISCMKHAYNFALHTSTKQLLNKPQYTISIYQLREEKFYLDTVLEPKGVELITIPKKTA